MPQPDAPQPDAETFSAEEAVTAQRELRRALGLGEERFPLRSFVGMISDEIEQLRAAGRTDADVAATIRQATGRAIDPSAIAEFYASPERRHGEHGN